MVLVEDTDAITSDDEKSGGSSSNIIVIIVETNTDAAERPRQMSR
jgi:hypothetical protein